MTDVATARTFLFVPADRPDRLDRARTSGADAVVVDLEDSVAPASKPSARRMLIEGLDPLRPVVVRINAAGTPWHESDLALAGHPGVAALMLPKAERPEDIARLSAPVIALVETARGLAAIDGICAAPGVRRLAFGTIDLALDLALPPGSPALDAYRATVALASRVAGLPPPIDGVTPAFDDEALVEAETRHAMAYGFAGRLCIHPRQVGPVHRALQPGDDEVAWARAVLDLSARHGDGAVALHGAMVDRPLVERARRLLARAASGSGPRAG